MSSSDTPSVMPKGVEHSPIDVEEAYFQAWGKVGGVGRLRRSFSLYRDIRSMLKLQVRKKYPGLNDREVKRRTAKRMSCR